MKRQLLFLLLIFATQSCGLSDDTRELSNKPTQTKYVETERKVDPVKISSEIESGSRPIDDLTHLEAVVIAKEFVAKKLNVSPPPTFDNANLDWIKIRNNFYKISSQVEAYDADGNHRKMNWEVKLQYKSGDWGNRNNWKLVDLKITE